MSPSLRVPDPALTRDEERLIQDDAANLRIRAMAPDTAESVSEVDLGRCAVLFLEGFPGQGKSKRSERTKNPPPTM